MHRVIVLALAVTVLGGCSPLTTCPKPPDELANAREIPPISVPLGLENPDTRDALRIPELTDPERPRGKDEGCLDRPPSYYPGRPPGAEREKPAG